MHDDLRAFLLNNVPKGKKKSKVHVYAFLITCTYMSVFSLKRVKRVIYTLTF